MHADEDCLKSNITCVQALEDALNKLELACLDASADACAAGERMGEAVCQEARQLLRREREGWLQD